MSLVKGQFTVDQYMKKKSQKHGNFPFAAIVIIIVLIVAFMGRGSSNGKDLSSSGSNIPFWLLMGGLLGGGRSSGGFGDFSSGGDSGGFGGFGGGSGGGGGAGGSW